MQAKTYEVYQTANQSAKKIAMKATTSDPIQRTSHETRRERRREMAGAVHAGQPYAAVAYKFGVTESHVRQACREFAIEFEKAPGSKIKNAKQSRKKKGI
jgi:hypothetical protein